MSLDEAGSRMGHPAFGSQWSDKDNVLIAAEEHGWRVAEIGPLRHQLRKKVKGVVQLIKVDYNPDLQIALLAVAGGATPDPDSDFLAVLRLWMDHYDKQTLDTGGAV